LNTKKVNTKYFTTIALMRYEKTRAQN